MNWELFIRKRARKNLAHFPKKDQIHIAEILREIVFNPYSGNIEKMEGEINVWRRRVGSYRILFELRVSDKTIAVLDIRRRTSSTY